MNPIPSQAARRLAPLGRIWRPYVARPWMLAAGVAFALVAAAALLGLPLLAGRILDAATDGKVAAIRWLCAAFAAVAIAEAALRYAARRVLIGESRRAEAQLKEELEQHLVRLPIAWFDGARSGDVVSRFTQDVETLRFTTGPALLYGLQAAVVTPGGIVVLWSMSPLLATIAAIAFGAMGFVLWRLAPAMQRDSRAVQDALGAIAQRASEAFGAIRLVQAAHRIRAEEREMERRTATHLAAGIALARQQARADLAIHTAVELVVLAGLAVGAYAVIEGSLSTGDLLQFYALLGVQLTPLLALGFVIGGLPRALGAATRLEEVFTADLEPRLPADSDVPPPTAAPRAQPIEGRVDRSECCGGRIDVRSLTYRLPGADRAVLADLSLSVAAGQTLGLVGAVGSGKSTLFALLLRFRDPPRGTVLVDGVDVLDFDPPALRRRFAVALQDPFLFDDSIADNVRFGDADADVAGTVADAGLETDLHVFPDGLDTLVGERGVALSGGQRQRIALARALATDRPILVLDDTLSAVDQETEARILERLRRPKRRRTTLIATHRLSTVREADRIAFLENGRLVGLGGHHELVRDCAQYAAVWELQRERAVLDGADP